MSAAPDRLLRTTLDAVGAVVTLVDPDGRVVACHGNGPVDVTQRVAPGAEYAQLCADAFDPEAAARLAAVVGPVVAGYVDRAAAEVDVRRPAGTRWLHVEAVAEIDLTGTRQAVVTHVYRAEPPPGHDRTDGPPDPHTGLRSHAATEAALGEALARCDADHPLGVSLVAVESLGRDSHGAGAPLAPEAAREAALRLTTLVGDEGTVGRLDCGGFVLVLPDADRERLRRLAESASRLLTAPAGTDRHGVLCAAQGLVVVTDPSRPVRDVLRDAGVALAHAQRTRGTSDPERYAFFEPPLLVSRRERAELEAGLRHAAEHGELHLAHQPVVDLATERVVSVEALLRWMRPRRGLVPPERVVAVAEETGLMLPLGSWVLRRALAQARAWDAAGHPVPVAVNVSHRQLTPGFVEDVRGALDANGLPPQRLVLEVPEPAVLVDPGTGWPVLRELRALGCRVAMDGFGAGLSSLARLEEVPVSLVKLDRSFVAGVTDRGSAAARVVETVLDMASSLGLLVVADGVATAEQAERLLELGCALAQGDLYSPPRDPVSMTAYLDAQLIGPGPRAARRTATRR